MPPLKDVSVSSLLRPSNIDSEYDNTQFEMLHHRRDPARSAKLGKFHITLTLVHGGQENYENRVWSPGYLATLALERLIDEGLDFVIRLRSNRTGNQIWPATYMESDPAPFFP
ncbi:hypothetical protein B0H13DRAFT_1878032 [Mycena leptocephala]|nr:hypothetical protein B0H13DRAFT_1878032 [Mycena leptocephala]